MATPQLINRTPVHVTPVFLNDEEARPSVVVLAKATFAIQPSGLVLAPKQAPAELAGVFNGDPGSSYRYEPETALTKLTTDVVLVGHAHAPSPGTQYLDVGIKVGPVSKVVRVFGDRYWVKTGGQVFATAPQPFQKIPLTYERAFGGWDKSNKDEARWTFEPRNPAGCGFGDPLRYVEEGKVPMPNVEDPNHPIKRYGDAPPPAGLGFVSPNWQPRARFAGTYDRAWDETRKPLLPKDFDRRFFNAASHGLVAPSYLKGDEDVSIVNAAPQTPLRFKLPALDAPACRLSLIGNNVELLRTNLDTVIIDTDSMLVFLVWRSHLVLRTGPHDVIALEVAPTERDFRTAVA